MGVGISKEEDLDLGLQTATFFTGNEELVPSEL